MKKHFLCLLLLASGGMTALAAESTPPNIAEVTQQNVVVKGVVTDAKGEPIIGATVTEKGTQNATVTDIDGNYSLHVSNRNATLVVSYIGYVSQEVKAGSNVTLEEDNALLNEVVVIGYGEVKKSDLTGSVANVKMSDVQEAAGLSVGQALQGRIAGVDIMTTSGDPSEDTSIRIRGTRSITASNEPLIIVDGVMDVVKDLSLINPDDIASISVLKDASATAIYGSQGANGVIMVTTKSASTSKPRIIISAEAGVAPRSRAASYSEESICLSLGMTER